MKKVKFLNHLIYKDYKDSDMVTVLSDDMELEGLLECSYPIKIKGRFKGHIRSSGFVWIDKGSIVEADLNVGGLRLAGFLKGNVNASYKVEILSGGHLIGNIRSLKLKISNGVQFQGNCEMIDG